MPYIGMQLIGDADLEHHGIKGQRWGVRRYQNSDGSLTSAGRARYGDARSTSARQLLTGGGLSNIRASRYTRKADRADAKAARLRAGENTYRSKIGNFNKENLATRATWQAAYLGRGAKGYDKEMGMHAKGLARRAERVERRAAKIRAKAQAEMTISAKRVQYDNKTRTGKMFMQNLIFGGNGGETYRDARALGATRGQALLSNARRNRKRALAGGY